MTQQQAGRFSFGPVFTPEGVLFRLWSPKHDAVTLLLDSGSGETALDMTPAGEGWFHRVVAGAKAGDRYRFRLPDGVTVPDPASRHQPDDVHGPSELIDPEAYVWQDETWKGRPWEETVLYELHTGTFTPEGTFRAAIGKLAHLKALGVTAIQLMPISDFPGRFGWGYDGTMPYAPEASYGRPEDLKALVDAAHQEGIQVFLDVVYNHFGPDGNYLPAYVPFFTDKHKTPWGDAINFDADGSEGIRSFMIENAIYWVTEFHLDGLRLDAVHAILDDSREHFLAELARRVRAAAPERAVHLVVENEENDVDLLARDADGQPMLYTAQWNDDIHHVLHIAATGETFGYYADFADDPTHLGRALAEGFVYQGEHMSYRGGERGKPSRHLPTTAFIAFTQNHDQIGNRAEGDRMSAGQPAEALKAIAAIAILSPQIPMLFMGEEWGAIEPFPYFCDFHEELNQLVREGRRNELSRLPGFDAEDAPDPTAPETFEAAKLDWSAAEDVPGRGVLAFYRGLLTLRHRRIVPLLKGLTGEHATHRREGSVIDVRWNLPEGGTLSLLANLSGERADCPFEEPAGDAIFTQGPRKGGALGPWFVRWMIEA